MILNGLIPRLIWFGVVDFFYSIEIVVVVFVVLVLVVKT